MWSELSTVARQAVRFNEQIKNIPEDAFTFCFINTSLAFLFEMLSGFSNNNYN